MWVSYKVPSAKVEQKIVVAHVDGKEIPTGVMMFRPESVYTVELPDTCSALRHYLGVAAGPVAMVKTYSEELTDPNTPQKYKDKIRRGLSVLQPGIQLFKEHFIRGVLEIIRSRVPVSRGVTYMKLGDIMRKAHETDFADASSFAKFYNEVDLFLRTNEGNLDIVPINGY